MRGDNHPSRVELRDTRERAIHHLTAAFVKDELTLEEYEQRIDAAYGCRTVDELGALLADLAPLASPASDALVPANRDPLRVEIVAAPGKKPRTVAILGNVERRGTWTVEKDHGVLSVMGNVELDLTDVLLPPGVTTLHVRAVLGNVEITVPPDLFVECDGTGILGSFSNVSRMPQEGARDGAVLRITGKAVLGNVEIRTRPRQLPDIVATRALPSRR